MGANTVLWNEYRATWEIFSRKLDELQACVASGDRRAEDVLLELEIARMAHTVARDRLAEQISGKVPLSGEKASIDRRSVNGARQRRVRNTAHLLWEIAGKPHGSADSDWRRAEVLVQSACASL